MKSKLRSKCQQTMPQSLLARNRSSNSSRTSIIIASRRCRWDWSRSTLDYHTKRPMAPAKVPKWAQVRKISFCIMKAVQIFYMSWPCSQVKTIIDVSSETSGTSSHVRRYETNWSRKGYSWTRKDAKCTAEHSLRLIRSCLLSICHRWS